MALQLANPWSKKTLVDRAGKAGGTPTMDARATQMSSGVADRKALLAVLG